MTYGVVAKHSDHLRASSWDLLILHGADSLKDPTSRRTEAIFGKSGENRSKIDVVSASRRIACINERAFDRPKYLYPLLAFLDRATWRDEQGFLFRYCDPIETPYGYQFELSSNPEELRATLRATILAPSEFDARDDQSG